MRNWLSKKVVLKENFGSNHDKQSTYILDDKNQAWVFWQKMYSNMGKRFLFHVTDLREVREDIKRTRF